MFQKLKFMRECLKLHREFTALTGNRAGRKITDTGRRMTEPTPRTTMDTLEDVPHFDPDPGKIHEQAGKQAANTDGLISLLQKGGVP